MEEKNIFFLLFIFFSKNFQFLFQITVHYININKKMPSCTRNEKKELLAYIKI